MEVTVIEESEPEEELPAKKVGRTKKMVIVCLSGCFVILTLCLSSDFSRSSFPTDLSPRKSFANTVTLRNSYLVVG